MEGPPEGGTVEPRGVSGLLLLEERVVGGQLGGLAFLGGHVGRVAAGVGETLAAETTLERLVPGVDTDVLLKTRLRY